MFNGSVTDEVYLLQDTSPRWGWGWRYPGVSLHLSCTSALRFPTRISLVLGAVVGHAAIEILSA